MPDCSKYLTFRYCNFGKLSYNGYVNTYGGVFIMAYKITDACIGCGACAEDCPVSAISEKDGKYEINKDECIDCGACAASCPVEAPVAE